MKVRKVLHVLLGATLALTTLSGCEDEISAPLAEEGAPATVLALTHTTVPSTTYGIAEDIGHLGFGAGWAPMMGEGGHVVGPMATADPGVYIASVWSPHTRALQDVGTLEGCSSRSWPTGVSATGVVAGHAYQCGNDGLGFWPFRWTEGGGFERLSPTINRAQTGAINRQGVVAGVVYGSSRPSLARWDAAGALEAVAMPADCAFGIGVAAEMYMNDVGTVAGSISCTASDGVTERTTPFVWPVGGSLILMETTWGGTAYARGLNNSGNVAGVRIVSRAQGFFWVPGGAPQDIGTLGGLSSSVIGISDSNEIAGTSPMSGDIGLRAFRWTPAGGIENLGLPPGTPTDGSEYSQAFGISRTGIITGSSTAATEERAFRWTSESGFEDLTVDPLLKTRGMSVNAAGEVSGFWLGETGGHRWVRWGSPSAGPSEPPTSDAMWDARRDFSETDNPNGAWSSGWTLSLGGTLNPFTHYIAHPWGVLFGWVDPNRLTNITPALFKNPSPDVYFGIPPGGIILHPGCTSLEPAVLRWTAPSGGTYRVKAVFLIGDLGSTSVHVLKDNVQVYGALSGPADLTYEGDLTLAAGGIIDVAVGANGSCSHDSTPIEIIIDPLSPDFTPSGDDVVITPLDQTTGEPAPATLTFDQVTTSGTTAVTSGTMGGPSAPISPSTADFKLGQPPTYYDITTDALFTGSVTICIDYSSSSYGNESKLKLLHFNEATQAWEDITTSLDTSTNTICGTTTSFSPFLVAEENVAPVVTVLSIPADPTSVGVSVSLSAGFTDENTGDTHTAAIDWGDGTTSAGNVMESRGTGSLAGSHAYSAPGVYTVRVTVTDEGGRSGGRLSTEEIPSYLVVYDPSAGFVTGGGWIHSPVGACGLTTECKALEGKATFGFVSRYKKGATVPDGNTEFEFKAGGLSFKSTSYQWLVISGPKGQYKGVGQVNGAGEYGFMLTVNDGQESGGGGVDRFRIKIWNAATDEFVYDSQSGDADDAEASTALGGGSIVIHNK